MIINSNLTNNTNSSQESNLELLNHLINIEDCNNNLNSLLDKKYLNFKHLDLLFNSDLP